MVTTEDLLRFAYKVKEGDIPQEGLEAEAEELLIKVGWIEKEGKEL